MSRLRPGVPHARGPGSRPRVGSVSRATGRRPRGTALADVPARGVAIDMLSRISSGPHPALPVSAGVVDVAAPRRTRSHQEATVSRAGGHPPDTAVPAGLTGQVQADWNRLATATRTPVHPRQRADALATGRRHPGHERRRRRHHPQRRRPPRGRAAARRVRRRPAPRSTGAPSTPTTSSRGYRSAPRCTRWR